MDGFISALKILKGRVLAKGQNKKFCFTPSKNSGLKIMSDFSPGMMSLKIGSYFQGGYVVTVGKPTGGVTYDSSYLKIKTKLKFT